SADNPTISATDGNGITGNSGPMTVLPGASTQLALTAQPSAGQAFLTLDPLQVTVEDAYGNPEPSSTALISVDFSANPGNATLEGLTSRPAAQDVVTFDG